LESEKQQKMRKRKKRKKKQRDNKLCALPLFFEDTFGSVRLWREVKGRKGRVVKSELLQCRLASHNIRTCPIERRIRRERKRGVDTMRRPLRPGDRSTRCDSCEGTISSLEKKRRILS
jgi:hypothetical protein